MIKQLRNLEKLGTIERVEHLQKMFTDGDTITKSSEINLLATDPIAYLCVVESEVPMAILEKALTPSLKDDIEDFANNKIQVVIDIIGDSAINGTLLKNIIKAIEDDVIEMAECIVELNSNVELTDITHTLLAGIEKNIPVMSNKMLTASIDALEAIIAKESEVDEVSE